MGEKASFTREGHVLRAEGDLDPESAEEFDGRCKELVESDPERPTIDLSAVDYIPSSYIPVASTAALAALRRGRKLTLVVQKKHAQFFERTEFAVHGDIKTVD